ncbi:MAG: CARDB domain-containing protein, partial [Candidatus Bipolaricaulota bacterium]
MSLLGQLSIGQSVDLTGPTQVGRCEQTLFVIAFTADLVQTASAIVFTATLPNAGFAYVPGSGLITLDDGTTVPAEPTPSGLNLTWDLTLILGTAYELPPGETVTVEFALVTGCGTISGTLGARVDFVLDGTGYWISDSQPVEILPGAVRIEKIPSVISAGVGDEVTWTLVVENTGLGPIYNVVVTDVLGSGLLYVSSDPAGDNAGQATTWDKSHAPSLEEIAPGGRVEIELRAEVTACSGLDNRADVQFGCDDGSVCFNTAVQGGTATASVALIPRNPFLAWTPPTIEMPYCSQSGVQVTIPIENVGEGEARNIRLCMDCSPLVVSDVGPGAAYVGGCFVLDDPIPAGGTYILTFTVTYLGDWCAGVPSGTVLCQSIYENVCGEEFRPPLQIGSFSTTYGPEGAPRLSVSLTGSGEVYICDVGSYDLEVSFSGLDSCGNGGTSDVFVVANVPAGFTVTDSGGGTWVPGGDGTGGTISWTTSPTTPLSTSFTLAAPGRLQCGQVGTLSATAVATDCCGCVISASDSAPIAIQCYQLVTASRTASPSIQEKCGEITYTNTYTFAGDGPEIRFTDLTFIAYAENAQEYVDGTLQITVGGTSRSPLVLLDGTPGGSLEVQGIDDASLVWGKTLVISYRLKFTPGSLPTSCPSTYSFYTWTTLDLGPGCTTGDDCTQPCQVTETLVVTAVTPSMSIAISGLPTDFADPCGTCNVTVTLTKTSTFDPHDVRLRLGSLNYYIVDTGSIGCSGVCPVSTVPTEYADYYEWDYADAFVGQPNGAQSVLTFQVRKRCSPGREITATALFTDSCLYSSCSVSASRTPSFLRQPLLYVSKTPEITYATQNPVTWTIYVTNGGAGPAYEVWVDDVLGSGLEYVSSTADPDVVTHPDEDHDGLLINGVSWRIPVIAPGATRTLTVTARMTSCAELTNWVQAGVGCGGEDCLISAPDSASVVIPTTNIVATASTNSPINTCAVQYATITVRNAGDPAVYDLAAEATLPFGISYVSGSTEWRKSGGSWAAAEDPDILGSTLTWTRDEASGLAELRSRQTLDLRFQIRADCAFTGGSLPFQVFYQSVCSAPGSTPVGTFTLDARRPQISVTKTQASPSAGSPLDCGGNVTWQIVVRNTGPIPVPYVWVEDEMDPGFTYISSSPLGNNMGSITTWEITDLPLNGTATLTLTAQAPGAGDPSCTDLSNTVRASWGCPLPDPCLTDAPASDTIQGTRTPTVSLSTALSPSSIPACGEATFTLTVQNTSTAAARAVDARITLPSGLSYVPGSTEVNCGGGFVGAPDPTIVGQALTWYDESDPGANLCAEIPANSSVQVRFRVKADCYVTAGNASIRVWYYDCCETTQRTADGSVTVARATPTLTITKLPATEPLDCHNPNNEVTWTVTVTNTGTASADWVRVEDTLGASLEYVSSSPTATPMGTQKWGWEFGPLGPNESQVVQLTARLVRPNESCASALRTNTAQAWWGCGTPDGDPNTSDGCTGGGPVTATARVTIPDLTLTSTNITPVLTCVEDGNHSGRVTIVVRNTGDAPVTGDFRMRVEEAATGWWREGYFGADFEGTLPVNANSTRTIHVDGWPVSCQSCTYRFTVTLDLDDDICECIEGNNANSRDWTITLPDLTVRRHTLSLTCAGDGQVLISGTVTLGNEGCGSALTANVPMRFVLRDGAGCSGTEIYGWTPTFTGVNIPAGGEQTFTVSHTFPIDLCTEATGCTVSLLIEADYNGSICECDGANNTLCAEFGIDIPDVVVAGENLTLTCAGDGQVLISGTVTLGNEGCGSALTANVPMRFVLHNGSGCSGTELYGWTPTFTGVNIPAGGEQTFTVSHTFPINLCTAATGCTVSLLIEADYAGTICECSGTNNARCVDFPVEIPDLAVTAVVPSVLNACDPGTVAVTVANAGCVESPAGAVVRITGAATGEITLPAIPAGETATVTVDLNEVLSCGFHEVTATVDPDAQVCECSSANNALGAGFTVVDPDLSLTDLVVLCQGDGSFTVTVTARNGGTEAAPPSTVRIWVDGALFHIVYVPAL